MTIAAPTTPPRLLSGRTVGVVALALTAVAIAVFAPLQYLLQPLQALAAGGNEIATNYAPRPGWVRVAFLAHVIFAGVSLLLSPIQLSGRLRARIPRVHRVTGRIVLASIAVAGAAGFLLSWFNVAGPIGTAGFGALAILWITFAVLGLRAVLRGDVRAHRAWMMRTFAMTYAAVTLRVWLIVLIMLLGDFHSAYLLVPFLSWVPNLIVVELILRHRSRTRTTPMLRAAATPRASGRASR
jgi:uncharacterized membrane protein